MFYLLQDGCKHMQLEGGFLKLVSEGSAWVPSAPRAVEIHEVQTEGLASKRFVVF